MSMTIWKYLFNKEIRNYIKNTCRKCSFYKNSKRFCYEKICSEEDIIECKELGEALKMNEKEKNLEEIKIDSQDKVKGFYILLTNSSVVCLPDNEYLVPKYILSELVKKGIKFSIKKKK